MIYATWVKRAADYLEKISAASMVVGLWQGNPDGFVVGAILIALSFLLTERK